MSFTVFVTANCEDATSSKRFLSRESSVWGTKRSRPDSDLGCKETVATLQQRFESGKFFACSNLLLQFCFDMGVISRYLANTLKVNWLFVSRRFHTFVKFLSALSVEVRPTLSKYSKFPRPFRNLLCKLKTWAFDRTFFCRHSWSRKASQ